MNPCKFQTYLTAYVLRDMDQKRLDAVDAHLKACPDCQMKAEELRSTIFLLKEAFPAKPTQEDSVLTPARRAALLAVKPLTKADRFFLFTAKSYKSLRMVAAGLLATIGIYSIIRVSTTLETREYALSTQGLYNYQSFKATIAGGGGGGGGMLSTSDKGATGDSVGYSIKNDLSEATADSLTPELVDSDKRMDAPAGRESGERAQAGEKLGDDSGWFKKNEDSSVRSKAKQRDRYDDGLEANQPVSGPASTPEPLSPQPAAMDAVLITKSPVILRNLSGSTRSGSAKLSLKGKVSKPEGATAAAPAETAPLPAPTTAPAPKAKAVRPPAPATPMPTSERLVRDKEVAVPEKPTSATLSYGLVNGSGSIARGPESGKDRLRQMESLKIGAAKPVFTGTPKDIRSPNLEAPGARENKPADYPVVSYERAAENKIAADSKLQKTGVGGLVMSETAVSAGTLIAGKRESKHAEKKQKEEEVSSKEITLTGANTFNGGTTVLDGTPATSDYKLGIKNELKKEKEDKTIARSSYSYAEPAKDLLWNEGEVNGRNGQLEKKLEERAEAADIRKKPAPPREPLPFNAFVVAAAEPFSTFAMDVDTASYTLTRQALRSGKLPDPERVRLEEIVNAFDYDDMAPDRATFRVYQDGAQAPFGAGYNLLRIGVKGRRLGREEQRPAMLTFVIDVSGSMSQPDRIGFARLALSSLLDQVSANDRIQIIAYSDQAQFVLEPTVATDKARVMAAFNRLQCNGSTNLEEGLRRAYEQAAKAFIPGAENRVILISDGVANLGADSAQEILDKVAANRKQGITCSVFGVGSGTYNDKMLEELANKGDGAYSFLDSAEAVKTAFVDDLSATLNTIAKDAKIQVEWNPKAVRQYRQMGYENRKLTKEQFRDDTVDAGEVGSGQSVTALYELELMPDVTPETLLGTVRIRYQRTDNGKVEEIESALVATTVLRPAHQATVPFRVAASAAEFAELLRGSPHAQNGRFETVADYLRPAALERSLDTRVKELLELVTTAASLSK